MSRADERYQIIDEPSPGPLARFAVNPMVPFLIFMVFPPLGAPFFLFNTIALNGRTWLRELAVLAFACVLRFGIPYPLALWSVSQGVPVRAIPYIEVVPIALSLWLGYRVFFGQAVTHALKTYLAPEARAT